MPLKGSLQLAGVSNRALDLHPGALDLVFQWATFSVLNSRGCTETQPVLCVERGIQKTVPGQSELSPRASSSPEGEA